MLMTYDYKSILWCAFGSFIGLGIGSSYYQWLSVAVCVVQVLFLELLRCT